MTVFEGKQSFNDIINYVAVSDDEVASDVPRRTINRFRSLLVFHAMKNRKSVENPNNKLNLCRRY